MLYTRKGDTGTSGLYGTSRRLPKDSSIFDALGSLDELNSILGICRAHVRDIHGLDDAAQSLEAVQEALFTIQAEVAGAGKSITYSKLHALEAMIDHMEMSMPTQFGFIIPGSTVFSAECDFARAVSRRAERAVWRITNEISISAESLAYLNRLSSFLYALARSAAASENVQEVAPSY